VSRPRRSARAAWLLAGLCGERHLSPTDYIGRGALSRGGLMLRSADEGRELPYAPVVGAARHGARPPRLAPRRRRQA
jgi:hypothetical protein